MEAPFFPSPMIETGRYSTLHFLNEGVEFHSSLSLSRNGRVKNGVPYRQILL